MASKPLLPVLPGVSPSVGGGGRGGASGPGSVKRSAENAAIPLSIADIASSLNHSDEKLPDIYSLIIRHLAELRTKYPVNIEEIRMPICLAFCKKTDKYASEFIDMVRYVHKRSSDAIDFFLVGWKVSDQQECTFDDDTFIQSKQHLERKLTGEVYEGDMRFLILDAQLDGDKLFLDFTKTIAIDVPALLETKKFRSVSGLVERIIKAAEQSLQEVSKASSISDTLGLETGKQAILDGVLNKLGSIIGADALQYFSTRSFSTEPLEIDR